MTEKEMLGTVLFFAVILVCMLVVWACGNDCTEEEEFEDDTTR